MRSSLIAIILAVVLGGGFFYYMSRSNSGQSPSAILPTNVGQPSAGTTAPDQASSSPAINYDECVARGGSLLPGDSTKCLTKDGHVFIQGVTE